MIEINLLPAELRQAEGTPLPRLFSILVGVILVTMGGVVAFNYHFVHIKKAEREIKELTAKKNEFEAKANEVRALQAEIDKAQQKVSALRNLTLSRIRWARLLYQFRKTIPDGCVIKSWRLRPTGGAMGGGPTGKRYDIELSGYTTGNSEEECAAMFRLLSRNFKRDLKDFDVVPPAAPGKPPSKYAGFNRFVGLKFGDPDPGQVRFQDALTRPGDLPEHMDEFKMPPKAMEFSVTIPCAMPPLDLGQ